MDLIALGFNLGLPLLLLLIGYGFGRLNEQRHYQRLRADEASLAAVLAFSERLPPANANSGALVIGAVVIGQDYFKAMLAGLRALFGGSIGAYETLLDRARREALVRMKRQAQAGGATMVTNIKFSTARIGLAIEVVAYGTAIKAA